MKFNLKAMLLASPQPPKVLLAMNLTVAILLLTLSSVSAKSYSQAVTLNERNASIERVLQSIENQTGYNFLYKKKDLQNFAPIHINVTNVSLAEALDACLKAQNVTYRIFEKTVVLKRESISSPTENKAERIEGTVTDSKNMPLAGASINVKGTSLSVVSAANGQYSITITDPKSILVFSFVGYETREVAVKGQNVINVQLMESVSNLDEAVVVGYGTQKKINLTGAISTINFEDQSITSRALQNVSSALAGMAAGLSVTQTSGAPSNNSSSINIRGMGSLNASQQPLVLIDGQVGNMNSISPNDVASISVLKDAASAAIYGSRASNGVILITTKTGKNTRGKVTFSYAGLAGFGKPLQTHDVISNTPDHMSLINLAQRNSGLNPSYTQAQIDEWRQKSITDPIGYPNTDWWKALTKSNLKMNHHFSARGGNDRASFYTSVSQYSDNGLIPNTAFKTLNFRNNLTYKVTNWLELGNIVTLRKTEEDPGTEGQIFTFWRATTPGIVPKHSDGRYGGAQTPANETGANNPLRAAENPIGENNNNDFSGKIFGILTPFKGFSTTFSYFTEVTNNEGWISASNPPMWDFRNEVIVRSFEPRLSLNTFAVKTQREVIDLYSSYEKSLNKHKFKILLGYNQEYFKTQNINATKSDLLSLQTPVLSAAPSDPTINGNASDFAIRSLFGRLNYDFESKYLFEANLRYDGSSRFSPENRWGIFPSFSAGWRVSEEPFWSGLKDKINNLKIRASWGQLGNSGIGNYEWQSIYASSNHSFNSTVVQGLRVNSIANQNITWEKTEVINLGIDFSFLRAWTFDINYYNKNTSGILTNIPIPFVNGGITAPRVNAAEVNNTGIEGELRYNARMGDLSFSVAVNGSYNRNKIVQYKGAFIEPRGNFQAWAEGKPIGIYWVREIDYIVQDKSQVDELIAKGYTFSPSIPGPGDFMYKDANGDKVINDNDRVLKGQPLPLYNYGANFSMNYKGIDAFVLMAGVAGWDKYLKGDLFSTNRLVLGYLAPAKYLDSWTPENRSNDIPKLYTNNIKNNLESDYFLHNAAYLKIKSIQLGYTVPVKITNTLKVEKFRIYANLENYFNFTSFPGQDPENNDISYPLSKVMSIGLNVSF